MEGADERGEVVYFLCADGCRCKIDIQITVLHSKTKKR